MQTPRTTRSSTLGKRNRPQDSSAPADCEQLLTPEPSPSLKRARTSSTVLSGDHNKENIPPYNLEPAGRATRSLRRSSTEAIVTPTRPRAATLSRHVSLSSELIPGTPTKEIGELRLQTPPPTPTSTLTPTHVRVKALLRSTTNGGGQMSGRTKEYTVISSFINSFLAEAQGCADVATALYISGSPGTGKTALVHSILSNLDLESQGVRSVVINCMALNNLDGLRDRLIEEFGSKALKARKFKSKRTVEALFANIEDRVVLVLDELDHIVSSIETINELFQSASSKLRVIGIANTHTLSSSGHSQQSTTAGIQTIHFAPYTPNELLDILKTRLSPLKDGEASASVDRLLPAPALTLLTKKIAAVTGDVRSLFEVLRGSIDLAVAACNGVEGKTPAVSPANILAAIKAHTPSSGSKASSTASEIVSKVRALGLQARLVLLAIVLAVARLDVGLCISGADNRYLDAGALFRFYGDLLAKSASGVFPPVSRSELGDLLSMLEGVGLLSSATSPSTSKASSPIKGGSRKGFGRSVSFGGFAAMKNAVDAEIKLASDVWADEVIRGLGIGTTEQEVIEEEIQALYDLEKGRLAKDVQAEKKKNLARNGAASFEDAMED